MLEGLDIACSTPAPGWLLATVGQLGVAYDGRYVVVALATAREEMDASGLVELEAIEAELKALPAEIAPAPIAMPPAPIESPPSVALVRVPRLDLATLAPAPRRTRGIQIIELTPRERQVIALCAEGFSNKEIASALGISFHTARFHVNGIIKKLGARDRTHAAVLCVRRELAKA